MAMPIEAGALYACLVVLAPGCAPSAETGSANPCATGAGLDPEGCLLPWPSSAFLLADASTRTGFRVRIPAELMPRNDFDQPVDPAPWNFWDGFSPMTTLLADFGSSLDPSPLPSWHDPGASLSPDSPTVIVDVDTGDRVAHFAEIEGSPEVRAGHTTLYIRPAARLLEGHHYAVGIRGLRDRSGAAAIAPAPFAELRDREPSSLEARRAAFERDVFAPLAAAGVERRSLLLARDFRTASGQTAWGDLVAMRDAAFALAGAGGLGCQVDSVVEDPTDTEIFRRIEGHFTVPSFLHAGTDGSPRITRDEGGQPITRSTVQAPFTALIPRSALGHAGEAPLWILVMSAQLWDLAEASPFAPHLLGGGQAPPGPWPGAQLASPLPGSRAVRLLFQVGLYDADTTNVASEIAGRTLGLPELSPNAHAVWGLSPAPAPQDSAFVVYDLGAPKPPDGPLPAPVENGVHEGVRRDPRAQAQIVAFLHAGGRVIDTCGGPCAPMMP